MQLVQGCLAFGPLLLGRRGHRSGNEGGGEGLDSERKALLRNGFGKLLEREG